MKAPVLSQTYDAKEMQRVLDDLYQYIGELQSKTTGKTIVDGTTTDHKFQLQVEDSDITNLSMSIKDMGKRA